MNVRLVAYRKATSDATYTTGYNLDLQEEPNVSINYKFSELSDPSARKASYSQTFKLPFTDNNNQFFQEWYNVNLETLVFSAREAFDVILYVGTIPQFEGLLHLKSVYKKAGYYEVVILSSIANLFTNLGEKRLKDVFRQANGSYTDEYNHTYEYTSITNNVLYNSWTNTLQNTAGTTLSDGTVAKIVYPMSINIPGFYYPLLSSNSEGDGTFLRLSQAIIDNLIEYEDLTPTSLWNRSVSLGQFKPAIQIRELFQKIIAQAGMSYTSTFIDSAYFRKIYMTLGGFTGMPSAVTVMSDSAPSGAFRVGHDEEQINLTDEINDWGGSYGAQFWPWKSIKANLGTNATCMYYNDFDGLWDVYGDGLHYFHKADVSMTELVINNRVVLDNIATGVTNPGTFLTLSYKVTGLDPSDGSLTGWNSGSQNYVIELNSSGDFNGSVNFTIDISEMPPNTYAYVSFKPGTFGRKGSGTVAAKFFDLSITPYGCPGVTSSVSMLSNWNNYTQGAYGDVVDVPGNVDPEITQKEFLKDIIQRFNLVFLTNPDDDTNLLIEPYNDFIASGVLKNWTDKLDVSKEIVVKDTTEIQKKTIHFTDQEDDDLYNNSIRENFPQANVYGNIKIQEHNNEFALGELKNEPLFAPYINSVVFRGPDESEGTLINMTVQYEFSTDASLVDLKDGWKVTPTKPKLFWYNGTPTEIKLLWNDSSNSIYLHRPSASTVTAYEFDKFPVCSPFDITPGDGSNPDNEYTLTPDNKSLYWNANPPLYGSQPVFNYTNSYGSWFKNSLFGLYWRAFIDNIYNKDARIMECYMNLNEVDIFQFSFADEIFIKDSYWRILEITNYQVGAKASTKVKLIKSLDTLSTNTGCDYVLGEIDGNNVVAGYYVWCPENDPDCVPVIGNPQTGLYVQPDCCTANGGLVAWNETANASSGLYPCLANAGSFPLIKQSAMSGIALINPNQLKSVISRMMTKDIPFVKGDDNTKFGTKILPYSSNDIVIKYKSPITNTPQFKGESHRLTLSGYTVGNTRGYAYLGGDRLNPALIMPPNVNVIIRVKGTATVVGGKSSTYTVGVTEAFAYYTAFQCSDAVTQLGTAGGEQDFTLRPSGLSSSCTLNIEINSDLQLEFGLDDSQTDTKRIWNLSVELDINEIENMTTAFDAEFAYYENLTLIQLQNYDALIWN